MASREDIAKQYMDFQREGKIDEMLGMLSDDVSMTTPMTGTISGKSALEQSVRNGPMAGGGGGAMGNITWAEPVADGEAMKIVGTGSPFGPIKIVLSFNAEDQINRIDAGLA